MISLRTSQTLKGTQALQGLGPLQPMPRMRRRMSVCAGGLNIDRRAAFESSWRRQQEKDERAAERAAALDLRQGSHGKVIDVQDLDDLDMLLEKAGSSLVIIFFHSKTCGVCKDAGRKFLDMAEDAARSRARVTFLRADVHNEYDMVSDIAQWHKVKLVPSFLFMDGGAVVKRLSLRDVRRLTGTAAWIQSALHEDMQKLKATFREVMLTRAPSAR